MSGLSTGRIRPASIYRGTDAGEWIACSPERVTFWGTKGAAGRPDLEEQSAVGYTEDLLASIRPG